MNFFVAGHNETPRSGQATLSFILLVGGIIVEIALAGLFITYFLSTSGAGERFSVRALAAAHTGIRDAQLRIVRNKDFAPGTYTFTVGSDSASVTIARTPPDPITQTYLYTITSVGTAFTRRKKLVALMVVNTVTGFAQLQSLTEQSL